MIRKSKRNNDDDTLNCFVSKSSYEYICLIFFIAYSNELFIIPSSFINANSAIAALISVKDIALHWYCCALVLDLTYKINFFVGFSEGSYRWIIKILVFFPLISDFK